MDTGRIKMENYQGVLYCDAYMEDEFSLDDLAAMRAEIHKNFHSNADVILKKVGTYSVSVDAQTTLWKGIPEFRNFIYVVDNDWKRESAEYAAMTYMQKYNTRVASSREEAMAMLGRD
ncbi:hypothetical protein [Kaarinaea lacus]